MAKPKVKPASLPKVQVEAHFDPPNVKIKQNENSNSNKVKALIHLEAPAAAQRSDNTRIPLPVAVVVDVQAGSSHQGAGERTIMDLIREESSRANRHDDDVIFMDDSRHNRIIKPQDNPMSKGVTKLKQGLEDAIGELNKRRPSSVVGTGQRGFIILVSDGRSEFDDQDEAFRKVLREYPVHAFGLGFGNKHDASEWEVLQGIVSISKGTFSFIPVTDGREKLGRVVVQAIASCLAGLATVVAMDTRVTITCAPTHETNCIKNQRIENIECGAFDSSSISSSSRRQASKQVSVGYLSEGEAKDLIVHVAFNSDDHDHLKPRWLQLTATVKYYYYHYNSGSSSWHKEEQTSAKCIKCEVRRARDKDSYEEYVTRSKQPKPEVLEQMIIHSDVVPMLLGFAWEGFQGGSEEKSAEDLLRRWEELKQREGGNLQMAAARLRKTRDLIRRIGMDIEAMASSLERGWGLGCIYSWVSSNQMQRATTTSLPPPPPPPAAAPSPFLTPAMEAAARNVSNHYSAAAAKKEPQLQEQQVTQPQAPPSGSAVPARSSSSSPAAQPGGTSTTTLDDDTKRQRGKSLLDVLVPLLEEKDNDESGAIKFSWHFWKKFEEVVEAATNDATQKPTTATTTEVVDDHLKDGIKSEIAKWLFNDIVELRKGSFGKDLEKIYKVAEKATSTWKKNM